MSFHSTNFGSFAGRLAAFADNSGYVPQKGDKARDFSYAGRFSAGPRGMGLKWSEFVAAAVEATEGAQVALNGWREWSGSPGSAAPRSADMFGRC
jgi:hypothetical protein